MHTSFILTAIVAIGAATGASASASAPRAALPKANELTSGNCAPGTGSYEHHSAFLGDVTMNDGSHSVYFAAGPWDYFSGKTKEGGYCTGDWLERWKDESHPCVNLDTAGSNGRRIKATFDWSPSRLYSTGGAYLILPPVSDGIVGTLNGKRLPAFDITNPTADIKSYLKKGENVLELKVSSTLKNSLKPIWDNLRTAGGGVASSWDATAKLGFGLQYYGLIGEVQIVPYGLVPIL